MTWYAFALTLGFLIGNVVGGVLGDFLGFATGFAVAGVSALAGALGVALQWGAHPESPAERSEAPAWRWPTHAEVGGGLHALLGATGKPEVASVGLVAFAIYFYLQMGAAFFPLYGLEVGLSLTELGIVRSVQSILVLLFTPLAIWPVRWWGSNGAAYVALVGQALVLSLVPAFTLLPFFLVLFGFNGVARGLLQGANGMSLAKATSEGHVGKRLGSGVFNAGTDLGNIVGPIVCGFVATQIGLAAMFLTVPAGVIGFVAVILVGLTLRRRTRA